MHIYYSIFATLSILVTSAFAAPQTHTLQKRNTTTCGGAIKLRLHPEKPNKPINPAACLELNQGKAPYLDYKDGDTVGKVTEVTAAPAGAICEHIVEVQLVKAVLESPGGACDEYAKADDAGKTKIKADIKMIADIVNDKPNLIFAQRTLEASKGAVVNAAHAGSKLAVPKRQRSRDAKVKHLKAVNEYVNNQFKANAQQVVADLDCQISQLFPQTSVKVADEWKKVTDYAAIAAQEMGGDPDPCPA